MRKLNLTVVCIFLYLFGVAQTDAIASDSIFTRTEQMPYFTGCEAIEKEDVKRECSDQELVRFISRYLVYPEKARYDGIEGTVYVSFIIDQTGLVIEPRVLMDIGGGCGEAALDVIKEMPRWEPATHQGQVVKVSMNLPIQFFLRAEGIDEAEPYSLSWGSLSGSQITRNQLQDNLSRRLYVRGPEGGNKYVDQIEFIYEKDNRLISASSRGDVSPELEKVVERVKKGGTFTIYASVQDNGRFVTVARSFAVVK